MPTLPLSVLLPCRDAGATLPAALASVSGQTFRDFEVIAVDDGSGDATPGLLRQWSEADPRVRVITQPPQGLVAALNRATAEARAPLLARMDADDIAHPRRFERQVALLDQHPEVGVAGCLVRCFPRAAMRRGMRRYEQWVNSVVSHEEIERDLFVESPLPHPCVVMRADAVRGAGGYQDCGWPEDYDLWLRLFARGVRFVKVPEVLHFWRDRPERLSRTHPAYASAQFRRCKVHYLRETHLRDRDAVAIWGAGKEGKALARHLRRAGVRIARFIDVDPNKIGQVVLQAPVVGVEGLRCGEYLLVAVGAAGAREEIRAALNARDFSEPEDFRTLA